MSEENMTDDVIDSAVDSADIPAPKKRGKAATGDVVDVATEAQVEKRINITIPRNSDADSDMVQVAVNGRVFLIKRDEVVNVPVSVVHVLQNAKELRFNPKTGESREVMSYPFQYA